MKKTIKWFSFFAGLTLMLTALIARAASVPPVAGEKSRYTVFAAANGAAWTAEVFRNGTAVVPPGVAFKQQTGVETGQFEASITWPAPGYYLLRFTPSAGNATRYTEDVVAASAAPTAAQIDAQLTGSHGAGPWSAAGGITVLPFQGAASYETVAQSKDVHVTRGDSVAIPYSVGKDITGWTAWFGAKANPADTAYAVPLREVTAYVTDPGTGSGLINLGTADTSAAARKYQAELEIRKAGEVNTALKFNLWIDADVIR